MFDQFLKERRFLKNVTDATLVWYRVAFTNYTSAIAAAASLPTKATLQHFVVRLRERGIRPVTETASLDHRTVVLPFTQFFDDMWKDGFASATGTWAFQNGEKLAWPEQATKINCSRERGECIEAQAIVSDGDDKSHTLSVDLNYYDIERWDEHEIVTRPLESGCTRYVLRFNRVQKSVTAIRSTISKRRAL